MERRLAAILAADVVGYSRLMGADEAGTLNALKAHRRDLIDVKVAQYNGHIIKLMGDGMLMEFTSVVDAVACAVFVQLDMRRRNRDVSEEKAVNFRIGVNIGDVIVDDGDIYGDGVNVAARLEALARPGGICISRNVRDEIRGKLDLTLEDQGEVKVKNISRPVRAFHVLLDAKAETLSSVDQPSRARGGAAFWSRQIVIGAVLLGIVILGSAAWWRMAREDPVLALPGGPSIAVLPFTNLSGDPSNAYFSIGLTEDIIAALSRFSDLLVFARESTGQFSGELVEAREVGRKLGAQFVLAGSVRRSQDHLRVTTKLIDAEDGSHLWSATYDRDLTAAGVFALQDEITEKIVGIVASPEAPLFKSRIQKELGTKRPDSLEAYECVLLSIWVYDSFLPEAHARARECLERVLKLVPDYSEAWAHLAQMYFEEHKYGYNLRPGPVERALAATQKALALDPRSQHANYVYALILYARERSFDPFYDAADRAIALNPNNAFVLADLGTWIAYSGEWQRGRALVEKSMKLNPFHASWLHISFFLDHYRKGKYREALETALKMNLPNNAGVQTGLAAVYGQLGEREKATATLDRILAITPGFAEDPRAWFVRRRIPAELVESLMDGLRKAGMNVPPAEK